MSVFKRNNSSDDPIPEDLKPYYEGKSNSWKRWLGPVLRGLVLLAVLALLVWGGIWGVSKIIHRNDDTSKSTASTASSSNDDSGSKSATPAPTSKSPTPTPATTPTTPTPPTTTSPTPTPAVTPPTAQAAANPDALANTGPGEVIAAFVATVVLATVGFYFIKAYQLTASQK